MASRDHVDEALVPLQEHVEIRIDHEGGPVPALGQQYRRFQIRRGQPSRSRPDPGRHPVRRAFPVLETGLGPVEAFRHPDFLHPGLVHSPAEIDEHPGTRHQGVRRGALQVDLSVAVPVDAIKKNVLGQHLDHSDFAGPCACRVGWVQAASLEQLDRGQDLRSKQFRPPAVMGKREQRIDRVEVALNDAEVGLEAPEGKQDASRNAVLAFDAIEDMRPFPGVLRSMMKPVLADQAPGKLDEGNLEYPLRPVCPDDLRVVGCVFKEAIDHLLGMAVFSCLVPDAVEKRVEGPSAGLGADRRGAKENGGQGKNCLHVRPPSTLLPPENSGRRQTSIRLGLRQGCFTIQTLSRSD